MLLLAPMTMWLDKKKKKNGQNNWKRCPTRIWFFFFFLLLLAGPKIINSIIKRISAVWVRALGHLISLKQREREIESSNSNFLLDCRLGLPFCFVVATGYLSWKRWANDSNVVCWALCAHNKKKLHLSGKGPVKKKRKPSARAVHSNCSNNMRPPFWLFSQISDDDGKKVDSFGENNKTANSAPNGGWADDVKVRR